MLARPYFGGRCGELASLEDEADGEVSERGVDGVGGGVIELFEFGCVGVAGDLGEVADGGLLLLGVLRVPDAAAVCVRRLGFSAEFDGEDWLLFEGADDVGDCPDVAGAEGVAALADGAGGVAALDCASTAAALPNPKTNAIAR
ncbi:MAG: hypothetical protein JSR66_17245 [Proteobacteria bacterium]|nr:hypothetical protein [Pseudomonadota bacterium]